MKIEVKVDGLKSLQASLQNKKRQVGFAAMKALNATAKKVAQEESRAIVSAFDRPRPSTIKAIVVKKWSRYKGNDFDLEAVVAVDDYITQGRTGSEGVFEANRAAQGKGAISPAKYLSAQILGGKRMPKRFEVALQRAGIMPAGMMAVFAKRSGALDPYGNLPGPKIVQILSYFQAFQERGFRANMKKTSKRNLALGKRKGMKWGMSYFRGGKGTGLPDGIWERHYPNGESGKSFIRPILIYIDNATYRRRFDFYGIARRTIDATWPVEFSTAFDAAMRTAK